MRPTIASRMPSPFAQLWTLDTAVAFLNHGSYGAAPRDVLAAQSEWRARMEAEPVRFFVRDLERAMDDVRAALGRFVGADPDDVAPVTNATAGFNTVPASLAFQPNDELVLVKNDQWDPASDPARHQYADGWVLKYN